MYNKLLVEIKDTLVKNFSKCENKKDLLEEYLCILESSMNLSVYKKELFLKINLYYEKINLICKHYYLMGVLRLLSFDEVFSKLSIKSLSFLGGYIFYMQDEEVICLLEKIAQSEEVINLMVNKIEDSFFCNYLLNNCDSFFELKELLENNDEKTLMKLYNFDKYCEEEGEFRL